MAQAQDAPAPNGIPRLHALDVFVGTWHAEGTSYAHDPHTTHARAHPVPWVSDEHYEWLPGGAFLLHRWQADVGGEAFAGAELIGYEQREAGYFATLFDNAGNHPRYRVEAQDRRWTFSGEETRATVLVDGPDQMTFHWEWKHADGRWLPLCERVATRRADPAVIARALYDAYASGDRAAAERLVADDFHFTSPNDNALDRAAYFEFCWPKSGTRPSFDLTQVAAEGDQVFVSYDAHDQAGHRFRNTEVFTIRDGLVRAVEVFFGWKLPHPVAPGTHRDPAR